MRYLFADCRWALDDPELGRRLYLESHIPGAVFVDLELDLASPNGSGGRHPLPATEQFVSAMSRAGIEDGVFVVAYGSLGGAERLWWLLRHYGHDDCAVIDFDAWRGPLASGDEHVEPATFVPRERTGDTTSIDELVMSQHNLVPVDARVASRWRGEANPVDKVPGRIPGAVNAPWNEPLPDLPDGDLVAYCGSGVTACVVIHRLALAGRDARLYPGSWSEWEQHPELPVERS
ncbi:MAG TPA: rhodanese-like domain-containing protein [Gaiellaceae bacterium]|nr:rhodanese-like domain-containing protein [Gaiellaceae bacterium]